MSDSRPQGRSNATPYAYSRGQRTNPHRKLVRGLVPLAVIVAMLLIPVVSGELSQSLHEVRLLAADLEVLEDAFREFHEQRIAYRLAHNGEIRDWPAELADVIPDDLVWELKNDLYYSENDPQIYADFHQFMDALAHENYHHIPQSLVDTLKHRVSPTLVKYIKKRMREIQPSPAELKYVALREGVAIGVISNTEARMLSVDNRVHEEIRHLEEWNESNQRWQQRQR